MSVDISVVILSYDRVHLLERTLRGCARQGGDWGRFEIIVVDNHPDELARPLVEGLAADGALRGYLPLHAVRGDLLESLGRHDEAHAKFTRAAALPGNARERAVLLARAEGCAPP